MATSEGPWDREIVSKLLAPYRHKSALGTNSGPFVTRQEMQFNIVGAVAVFHKHVLNLKT